MAYGLVTPRYKLPEASTKLLRHREGVLMYYEVHSASMYDSLLANPKVIFLEILCLERMG